MSVLKTILYTQKTLSNGQHPVMLYMYDEKAYRISLGYSCKPKDWDKVKGKFKKSAENHQTRNLILRQKELKANEIIDDFTRHGKLFSIEEFRTFFKGKKTKTTFYEFMQHMIDEKKKLGKIGTMLAYKDGLRACSRFRKSDPKFTEVTYGFLKGIETLHYQRGCTAGGIGAYMRSIRAMYFEGLKRGLVDKDLNPFSTVINKNGYSLAKLKSKTNPKSLSKEEMEKLKLFNHNDYPELSRTWRLFMFSFYLFGMNFADMCELTKENIHHDRIHYTRKKTKKPFSLKLNPFAKEILDSFPSDGKYLFPIYREEFHLTPIQKKDRATKVLKKSNRDLKKIAKILKIDTHLTFYSARHSSATTLKRNGVSTSIISEALGHSNAEITMFYLKSFDNDVLDSAMDSL